MARSLNRSPGGIGPKRHDVQQARLPGGVDPEAEQGDPCFVVAIGASAGGQEALEQLFTDIPPDCGLSFVVVMHLPPDGPSFLAEMLARYTTMDVETAEEGMPLLPNRVQVIPAGRELTLRGGRLGLEGPDGAGHPVDRLFRSLAADPTRRGVAVVLSGSGTDGAAGALAIRESGGTVVVQEPGSALYPGMPESVISAGAADLVLPPEEIPVRIAEIARGTCALASQSCTPAGLDEELQTICGIIKERTGHDYSSYKAATVVRRIERRMAVNEIGGLRKYVALLKESPQEAHALGQDILIGVTGFFRDPEAFAELSRQVIPHLFEGRGADDPVRVWHACCATGEEVYSMAILIREFLEEHRVDARVQLFATDIDEASIAQARAGIYPADVEGEVGGERLRKFFATADGRHYQVAKQLREMVIFAHHSLVKDPPFSRLDLIVCRNFLIYLNPDMQKRLIALFHQVLKPGGFLFLGASETVGRHTDLFAPVDKKWRIYQRQETGRRPDILFPVSATIPRMPGAARSPRPAAALPSPGSYAEKFLVERYAPPCVVVNEQYEAVYFSTRTSRFLAPPVGEPTLDIIRMAREELRPSLRAAIHKAFADQKPVVSRGVKCSGDGEAGSVTIRVEPIPAPPHAGKLATVVFEPAPVAVSAPPLPDSGDSAAGGEMSRDALVRQLEEHLQTTREQLQATIEQLETSNEGFMSTNEELVTINEEYQATNEELQATNEELETSKEELQALNEELATVNVELQGTVEEARQATADLENLFASSEIATIFLDRRLVIKRFSPAMAHIFNLIPADIGRPFRSLAGKIDWPTFAKDAETVLAGRPFAEQEVASPDRERCYLKRLLPYTAPDGSIEGIVVNFIDITDRQRLEEQTAHLASFPQLNPNPVLEVDAAGKIIYANPAIEKILNDLGMEGGDPILFLPPDLNDILGAWDRKSEAMLPREVHVGEMVMTETVHLVPQFGVARIYGYDSTQRKRAELAIQRAKDQWERTFDSVPDLIAIMDDKHRVVRANRAMTDRLGKTPAQCVDTVCFTCVHGMDTPPDFCPHARTLEDGRLHSVEAHVERLGGYFQITTVPLVDSAGVMTGSVHVARDITERKRAEEALRESEEGLKRAQEIAHLGSWELDLVNNRLHWSDEVYRIFGLQPQEFGVSYEAFLEAVHPDDRPAVDAAYSGSLREGRDSYEIEHRVVRKSTGEVRTVYEKCEHLRDETGRIVRSIGMVNDITERKKAEEALRKAHDELESRVAERTEELASTINFLQDEIVGREKAEESSRRLNRLYAVLSETNQAIVRASDRDTLFRDFCRIAVEEGGFLLSWVGLVNEGNGRVEKVSASGVTRYLDDILITAGEDPAGDGPTGIAIRQGTYCICNDFQNDPRTRPWHERGEAHGILSSASIALKQEGRVVGALTLYADTKDFFDRQQEKLLLQVGADISFALDNLDREARRRDTEQALQKETMERLRTVEVLRAKEQMLIQQSRLAALGEMIGNIAHQWRQPLNALGLTIQHLEVAYDCGGFSKEQFDASVAKAMEIVYHMSQTIDDFRNFYRPDKERSWFDLGRLIRKTVSLIEANFREDRIAVEIDGSDEQEINGYPNEYAQVLLNILMNARDAFLEREPDERRIVVRYRREGGTSVVTVTDNAGGIPEEIIGKIFDPYFTTKAQGLGTGVGLFMSKTIIEKNMGGRLSAGNVEGGAEFRIEV